MSNEFLNGLQAASNAVAGNVAGPVDILAFLLRKAGMPVPENPIGGSNWMTQKGLMAPVRQGASQVIGETAGLLGPAMVSQFGPQIARGLLKGGENLAAPRTLNPQNGAIVWHGSPHKFPPTKNNPLGEFDATKIGAGEGAQAYGHGHYTADAMEVGDSYRRGLSDWKLTIGGKDVPIDYANRSDRAGAAMSYLRAAKDAQAENPFAHARKMVTSIEGSGAGPIVSKLDEWQKAGAQVEGGGYLYKVDLPDEKIARMLDWDKPLSQQAPEVQKHFEPLVAPIRAEMAKPANPGWGDLAAPTNFDPTGQELLGLMRNRDAELTAQSFLANGLGDDVSRTLRAQGIPGIRYLDGSSRTAGQGTRNYVVFPGEEGILTILERNGQGLLGP